jgi:hypothetical protein
MSLESVRGGDSRYSDEEGKRNAERCQENGRTSVVCVIDHSSFADWVCQRRDFSRPLCAPCTACTGTTAATRSRGRSFTHTHLGADLCTQHHRGWDVSGHRLPVRRHPRDYVVVQRRPDGLRDGIRSASAARTRLEAVLIRFVAARASGIARIDLGECAGCANWIQFTVRDGTISPRPRHRRSRDAQGADASLGSVSQGAAACTDYRGNVVPCCRHREFHYAKTDTMGFVTVLFTVTSRSYIRTRTIY